MKEDRKTDINNKMNQYNVENIAARTTYQEEKHT